MFDRYTEPARRVIFFARYEAACAASPFIELEHLFLGIERQSKAMLAQCGMPQETLVSIRQDIEGKAKGKQKISTSVDLPLSMDCRQALALGAEAAEALRHTMIQPEHLLIGMLRIDNAAFVQSLRGYGLDHRWILEKVRLGRSEPITAEPVAGSLAPAVNRLRHILTTRAPELQMLGDARAGVVVIEGGWNSKQILGHLIDSASNNHQRFVRALIQGDLEWPSYETANWVSTQHYAEADWDGLIKLWTAYNEHLLWVILHIPEEKAGIICRIGGEHTYTLGELITSYADHMEHHLDQIPHPTAALRAGS